VRPDLRLSDADRAAVTDRLAKHYGEGRLDQAEFDERTDRAMTAQTQSDLDGLFADLPGEQAAGPAPRRRHQHRAHRFGFLVLVVAAAAVLGHVLVQSFLPWLVIALLAVLWLRRSPQRHQRW
jgi:hypothetical protein